MTQARFLLPLKISLDQALLNPECFLGEAILKDYCFRSFDIITESALKVYTYPIKNFLYYNKFTDRMLKKNEEMYMKVGFV